MTPAVQLLVAEPSPLYRGLFSQAAQERGAEVVFAQTLDNLTEMIKRAHYDVIVIDLEIIKAETASCFEVIAREMPQAAILVTMQPSESNGALKAEILKNEAAECMVKPIYGSYDENLEEIKQKLSKIIALSRRRKLADPAQKRGAGRRLVLIAASTGGQQALEAVLPMLSGDFPAPILVVLHMPAFSTENVAAALDKRSALQIRVAQDCDRIEAGIVYIAPGGLHMTLSTNNRILLVDGPPINGVKPSADTLFESAANTDAWDEILAVILTGMGKDGKKGLETLKTRLACLCIAQSEATCVVYGMPKAVVESGLADRILDLGDIAHGVETFGFSPLPQGKICL